MNKTEKIEKLLTELDVLKKNLEAELLLEKYYTQTDPEDKKSIEWEIKTKIRLIKLTKLFS